MKTLLLALTFVLSQFSFAQNVGINDDGSAPDTSAILHVHSDSIPRGMLIPRYTTARRGEIPEPKDGLMIYNTDIQCFEYYTGGIWLSLCGIDVTTPTNPSEEKPRMLGYGGGVGGASRGVPTNSFHDIDVRITYEQPEVFVELTDANIQYRLITNDWADARYPRSVVVLDGYLYMLIVSQNLSPQQWRVYRYNVSNIAAGGVEMNFVGLPLVNADYLLQMTSSSAGVFYFTHEAGNSANDFTVAKYSLAGTTFNYVESVTFGSDLDSFNRIMVDNDGDVYGMSTPSGNDFVRKFDPAGNLIYTTPPYVLAGNQTGPRILNWDDTFYFGSISVDFILNRVYLD